MVSGELAGQGHCSLMQNRGEREGWRAHKLTVKKTHIDLGVDCNISLDPK